MLKKWEVVLRFIRYFIAAGVIETVVLLKNIPRYMMLWDFYLVNKNDWMGVCTQRTGTLDADKIDSLKMEYIKRDHFNKMYPELYYTEFET